MEAHITEVQSPQSTSSRALTGTTTVENDPSRIENSGMETVTDFGVSIAAMIRIMPMVVVASIS